MPDPTLLHVIGVWAFPAISAIVLHEVAHGWVARLLGDPTATRLGRLSLNPVRHVDPVGTLAVPALLLLFKAPFLFGWARPVPVDFRRLRHPRQDMALVALAGPGANLLMAMGWALLLRLADLAGGGLLAEVARAGILVNAALMVLNLLPIPPLDGGRVLVGVLPLPLARLVARLEPFGLVLLVVLLVSGFLGSIIGRPLDAVLGGLAMLAGR